MAEKSADTTPGATTPADGAGNWWDSWISSAKTKSAEVYTMVRKDLDEIGSAVKSEATHVFNSTSTAIGKTLKLDVPESPANVMKKSLSTFIGQVSTALSPEMDDDDDTEVILSSGDTTMLSTYKKELEALQRVDATFLVPAESAEFDAWMTSMEAGPEGVVTAAAAARRLAAGGPLRAQYERLVPDAVSHTHFWERYLFRVALLQDRLAAAARRSAPAPTEDPVLAHMPAPAPAPRPAGTPSPTPRSPGDTPTHAHTTSEKEPSTTESDSPFETAELDAVVWDDEDFANDLELTEEQQILLLEEYEREIATKKMSKQTSSRDITISNNNSEDKTTNTARNTTVKGTITKPVKTTSPKQAKTKSPAKPNSPVKNAEAKSNTGKSRDKLNNKTVKKSPKKGKTDDCGNNIVEDYFGDSQVKDDASANSDESWEKEFEIAEADQP